MVMWSPFTLLFDPGLQFSFIATLGLIIGNPIVERRLLFIRNNFMRDITASTIAAQAGVLPLLLYQTGNLSLVSVAANILVLPVIPAAMALSGIAAVIAFIPGVVFEPFVLGIGLPAFALLAYIITVAEFSAQLPLASVIIPVFPFWVVLCAYAALAVIVMRENKKSASAANATDAHLAPAL